MEDISDIHRTEPYGYSQMIAGVDSPKFGEAKNSWLTGTSAWTFLSISLVVDGKALEGNVVAVKPNACRMKVEVFV